MSLRMLITVMLFFAILLSSASPIMAERQGTPTWESAAETAEIEPSAVRASAAQATDTPQASAPFSEGASTPAAGSWQRIIYASATDAGTGRFYPAADEIADGNFLSSDALCDGEREGISNYPAAFVTAQGADGYWGDEHAICLQKGAAAGYCYTAETAGVLSFSFSELSNNTGKKGTGIGLLLFANGVQLYPAEGTADALFPADYSGGDLSYKVNEDLRELSVAVTAGTRVEFLFTCSQSTSVFTGCGYFMRPTVTSRRFDTDFTAAATLGSTLSLQISAREKDACFAAARELGHLAPGSLALTVTPEDSELTVRQSGTVASVCGFYAKQMTEEVDYRLTAKLRGIGESDAVLITLESGSISIAEYLTLLYTASKEETCRELALATLLYGGAAQRHFSYKTEKMADAALRDLPQKAPTAPSDSFLISGEGTYRFRGATLILADTVELLLLIDPPDTGALDTASLYLAVVGSEERIPLYLDEEDAEGRCLVATVAIPFSALDRALTFTVCDTNGTQLSPSLTYSVDSYVCRTSHRTEQSTLLNALRAVGQAARAYEEFLAGEAI